MCMHVCMYVCMYVCMHMPSSISEGFLQEEGFPRKLHMQGDYTGANDSDPEPNKLSKALIEPYRSLKRTP